MELSLAMQSTGAAAAAVEPLEVGSISRRHPQQFQQPQSYSVTTSDSASPATERAAGSASASRNGSNKNNSSRPGDEQVTRWLLEYARRRDSVSGVGRRRDMQSLDELKANIAEHYTNLVESVARRFASSGEPMEDMVQEGFLGLLSALERYNPDANVKFSTYATHFIAGAIRHCLRDRGKIIKEPAWLHELTAKINKTSDTLTQTLGRAPHPAEIAQVLNLTEEAVEEMLSVRHVFQVASFDSSGADSDDRSGGGGSAVGVVDPEKIRSDKHVTLQLPIEDRIVLEGATEKLKALEQKVLFEFFYKDLNQTEIARKLGISCNYVSHILKNSTRKLKRIIGEAEVTDRGRRRDSSIVDSATGLFTASHTRARLEEELSRAARSGKPLALLVIDLTGLPQIAGRRRDEFWQAYGAAVKKNIRRMDFAGRYESDSLLVLLPQTADTASVVVERLSNLLLAVSAMSHGEARCAPARIGMAHYPQMGRTAQELLAVARAEAGMEDATEMPVRPETILPPGAPAAV